MELAVDDGEQDDGNGGCRSPAGVQKRGRELLGVRACMCTCVVVRRQDTVAMAAKHGEAGVATEICKARGRGGRAAVHGLAAAVVGARIGCGRSYDDAQGEAVQGLCSSASMARFERATAVMPEA